MAEKTLNLDNNTGKVQTKKILATEDKDISWVVGTLKENSVVKGIESLPSTTPNEKTPEKDKAFTLELIDLVKESNPDNINYLKNNFTFSVEPNSSREGRISVISDDTTPFNLKLSNNYNSTEQTYSNINRKTIRSEMVNDNKELKFVNKNLRDIPISGKDKLEILYNVNYNTIKQQDVLSTTIDVVENANKPLAYNGKIENIKVTNTLGTFDIKESSIFNDITNPKLTVKYNFTPKLNSTTISYSGYTTDESNSKIFKATTNNIAPIMTLPAFWFKNIINNKANNNAIKCWFSNEASKIRTITKNKTQDYIPAVLINSDDGFGVLINLEEYITKDFIISGSGEQAIRNPYRNKDIEAYSISEFPKIQFGDFLKSSGEVNVELTDKVFSEESKISIPLSNILGTDPIDDIIYPIADGFKINLIKGQS